MHLAHIRQRLHVNSYICVWCVHIYMQTYYKSLPLFSYFFFKLSSGETLAPHSHETGLSHTLNYTYVHIRVLHECIQQGKLIMHCLSG